MSILAAVAAFRGGVPAAARDYNYHLYVPQVASDKPLPPPTPAPVVDHGPVAEVYIQSIGVDNRWPLEQRDTIIVNGAEQLDTPHNPQAIAHYPAFGMPGRPGGNSLFSAHVNYYTGVATPFARIQQAKPGDDVWVRMQDGTWFRYTLLTNTTIPLSSLENGGMPSIVYPSLPANRERVTFISCGGDFIPNPSGVGGRYDSRVILTAERIIE